MALKSRIIVRFSIVIVTPIGGATLVVLLPDTKRLKSLPQVILFSKDNYTKALIIIFFSVIIFYKWYC